MFTTNWTPLLPSAFRTMRRELDEAFDKSFNGNGRNGSIAHFPFTIWEDDEHIYLEADVPGFSNDSLDISYKDGELVISGERSVQNEKGKYWHNERMFGRFTRSISLPDVVDAENLEAELENGVLYVTMTKKPEAQPKKITVHCRNGNKKAKRITENKS